MTAVSRQRANAGSPRHADRVASSKPAGQRRGRPARLSRELVVEAALVMLEREPDEPITVARIAREAKAVPAALYRHFESLDDILDSILSRVLNADESNLEEGASWESQLASWMHGLRTRLLRYPAVITLIGRTGRTSPAWLEASSTLVEILETAGLEGHNLAQTYLWILETTSGLVIQEAFMALPEQLANARASHRELSERARARLTPILTEMKRLDGDALFDFAVEQVVTMIALRRQTS